VGYHYAVRTIHSASDLRIALPVGKTVGFVPTMGALHEGHLTLLRRAKAENDIVVMSLFVNPTQFNDPEDFEKYPRDEARDTRLAVSAGVDYIFSPSMTDMYPKGFDTVVVVRGLTDVLEGASRPGHFTGVATIVAKLLNIVRPMRAYFGETAGHPPARNRPRHRYGNRPMHHRSRTGRPRHVVAQRPPLA
jgi:pantoate--beta-alanine ligase